MSTRPHTIGIDLDNTLVCYDALFYQLACEKELIPHTLVPQKHAVRDYIRIHAGDAAWQQLQGLAYGPRMAEAQLFPHARDVLLHWKAQGIQISIVSHKSLFSPAVPGHNLQQAALQFLAQQGLMDCIPPKHIYFLPNRAEKIATLSRLDCHVFIDDLPEVFTAPLFPSQTHKILHDPHGAFTHMGIASCQGWEEIFAAVALLHDHI